MNENKMPVVCMDRQTNIIKCTLNVGTAIAFSHQNNNTKQLRHCVLLTSGNSYTVPTLTHTRTPKEFFSTEKRMDKHRKFFCVENISNYFLHIYIEAFPVAYYRNGIPDAPPFQFVVPFRAHESGSNVCISGPESETLFIFIPNIFRCTLDSTAPNESVGTDITQHHVYRRHCFRQSRAAHKHTHPNREPACSTSHILQYLFYGFI